MANQIWGTKGNLCSPMACSGLRDVIFDLPKLIEILAMYKSVKCVALAFISGPKLTFWLAFLCPCWLLAIVFFAPGLKMRVPRF